ncbi:hypothetical protein GW17_00005083 [Ensete ventricosum]|nr:hypothetical protein GW17_00005083 [Ensete ventricosum]
MVATKGGSHEIGPDWKLETGDPIVIQTMTDEAPMVRATLTHMPHFSPTRMQSGARGGRGGRATSERVY